MKRALALGLLVAIGGGTREARADDAACIAASEAGLALRQQGRLKDALRQLATCAVASCPAEVSAECVKRIDAVNAAMPTIILAAKDGSGNDLVGAKVKIDGADVADALGGRSIALDPGEHSFTVEATGQPLLKKTLVLRQGEKDRRETIVIGPVATTGPPVEPPRPPPPPPTWNGWRTAGVVTGVIGLAGLGVGAAFGAFALSAQSREKTDCAPSNCASYAQGKEDYDTAVKNATASTAGLVVGGALVVTGIVLLAAGPKPGSKPSGATGVTLVGGPNGVRVGGSFW